MELPMHYNNVLWQTEHERDVSHCREYTSGIPEQLSGKGNALFLSNHTDKNANIKNIYMFIFT
jgi:hypothetical protein